MPVILVPMRMRQENCEFEPILSHINDLVSKQTDTHVQQSNKQQLKMPMKKIIIVKTPSKYGMH